MSCDNNKKVTKVLQKLLNPDFKIKNDNLNSILTHLSTSSGEDSVVKLDHYKQTSAWIVEIVSQWEQWEKKPSTNVLSFALNLTSNICTDEHHFVLLNRHNICERLIKFISVSDDSSHPITKLDYIKLVASLLDHKSGQQWVLSTNYWVEILCLTLKNHSINITREGCKFLAKLLHKSIKINEVFCSNLVQLIMSPLNEASPCTPHIGVIEPLDIREQAIYQTLCPTLNLITEILEINLNSFKDGNDMSVAMMFLETYGLEGRINSILLVAQNEEFVFDLCKIKFLISFLQIYEKFSGKGAYIQYEKIGSVRSIFVDILKEVIDKGHGRSTMKLSYVGLIYWSYIRSKMPICVKNGDCQNELFEVQMLIIQVFPIIILSCNLIGIEGCVKVLDEDDLRDDFVTKFCKKLTPEIMRIIFNWRKHLIDHPYMFDNATLALNYVVKSKKYFNRELGVISFQVFIYSLRDIVTALKENPERLLALSREHNFLTMIIDATTLFINEFSITWRDSIESICVMILAFEFLSFPSWPVNFVVKLLKLVEVAIAKYMVPNMALLIDNIDHTMALVGPMLYAKLHDSSWEVRDTALEVLCTISRNAKENFPSFKKIVLDAQLPSLILKMALNDGEAFVRATAVKCLQEIVQVPEFWSDLLKCGDVHEQLIQILLKETEGIVRSEAATLIAIIFDHQCIPSSYLCNFYNVMTHAATADLHWEVKVKALRFWNEVITCHLVHQGYIDGTFPSITFSKEHRKIVTLNEPEVKKRLIKVLNQLSETGCLAVLVAALQDDCDVEVTKEATKITKDFIDLLKKYNVDDSNANMSSPPSPVMACLNNPPSVASSAVASTSGDSQYHSMSPMSQISQSSQNDSPQAGSYEEMADSILDEIINSQDVNLLRGVYNETDCFPVSCLPMRNRRVITPSDFLKFTYNDLEAYASKKTKWMNDMDDFGSLLDDILKEYDDGDVNSMDCY
ncbi:hypothetical protein NQ317_003645 [Molorchus minor]|uniref:BRCA1-associated ATM activator 1 n=1 Tax=Molorchus minor TaxID=1323400 RepID=A0ABQ9JG00_9CUCU|nr:hypothetical protein NQ317_003645 [Molorchus minor]